jgi:hypothetical protein
VSFFGCASLTTEEEDYWDKVFNSSTKERFIPVELFTGGKWDGKHELILKEVSTSACASVSGKKKTMRQLLHYGSFQNRNK